MKKYKIDIRKFKFPDNHVHTLYNNRVLKHGAKDFYFLIMTRTICGQQQKTGSAFADRQ